MPGPITITEGGYAEQDSNERLRYEFDFDRLNLTVGAELVSAGTLNVLPNDGSLTVDSLTLQPGNRKVLLRAGPGTSIGTRYRLELRVQTNETPFAILEPWFTLRIKS